MGGRAGVRTAGRRRSGRRQVRSGAEDRGLVTALLAGLALHLERGAGPRAVRPGVAGLHRSLVSLRVGEAGGQGRGGWGAVDNTKFKMNRRKCS
jgi:hypothetical protein